VAEVVGCAWRHARDHVVWYGGAGALPRLRGQLAAYAVAVERIGAHGHDAPAAHADPRRGRDAAGLRDALVAATTLDEVARALHRGTGIDPRTEAPDPIPGPSPEPPSFARLGRRRPRRTVAEALAPA
jgi:hypothetical protein